MMFSGLQGMTIPEGVVTQIAKDEVVLWKLETSKPIILEVEKITSDTYAGETTYTGEQFVQMSVRIPIGGTCVATYGGVSRTLVATEDNLTLELGFSEETVTFGMFNGIDYNAETPLSGTLTIEGDYISVGCNSFSSASKTTAYCNCVKEIVSLGCVNIIPVNGFRNCANITEIPFPNTIKNIGQQGFYGCIGLESIIFPKGLENIASEAFTGCTNLKSIAFENITGWEYTADAIPLDSSVWESVDVSDSISNVARLTETNVGCFRRNV